MTFSKRFATTGCAAALAFATMLPAVAFTADADLPWREAARTWTAKLGERPSGGPWLLGEVVIYLGYSGKLTALSAETGDRVWAIDLWPVKKPGVIAPAPTYEAGVLYLNAIDQGNRAGRSIAVEPTRGKVLWAWETESAPIGPALVAGDAVLVTTETGWTAINRATGKELWRIRSTGDHALPPERTDTIALLPDYGGALRAVDTSTGRVRWQFLGTSESFPQRDAFVIAASRAAQTEAARQFFATSPARSTYQLGLQMCVVLMRGFTKEQVLTENPLFEPGVGEALWAAARQSLCPEGTSADQLAALAKADEGSAREGVNSSPTVHHDKVFIRSSDRSVTDFSRLTDAAYVLDLRTGAVLFRTPIGPGGSPAGDDDTAYFLAVTNKRTELHAHDISKGGELWVVDLSKQHVSNRARLVISDAFIYAQDVKIDRKTGAIESRVPYNVERQTTLGGPGEAVEPGCTNIGHYPEKPFVSRFDLAKGKILWAFSLKDIKNPAFRVACGEDSAFFYDDWDAFQYPVFGVRLKSKPSKSASGR